MRRYLTVPDLIHINQRMVARWGGIFGVRDSGLLESAVGRLQSGYYRDEIEEGAALCESILQNHPFLDGNKRTAIVAALAFLRLNGRRAQFADREFYDWLMEAFAGGSVNKDALDAWLKAHTR